MFKYYIVEVSDTGVPTRLIAKGTIIAGLQSEARDKAILENAAALEDVEKFKVSITQVTFS